MTYEPLHHKYRPQTFANLVGQDAIATTLSNAIRTERIAPAYLFSGPRGTGKTSSARILAKSLNCLQSDRPTEQPCGVCEVCRAIARGTALDVIEIDAASNTGVDNIRELIERAQFAPVQCRYKVYVIDECLTGDSLVQISEGLIRIDDPNIKGKKVLSYNDSFGAWEFKEVIRWLDQGERQTLVIKTANSEIRCTENHLIRTEQGWIAAKDVKEGAKILSPVNVDAAPSFTNLGRTDALGDLLQETSSKAIHTGKNSTTWTPSFNKPNYFDLSVFAGVEKNLMSPPFYKKKATGLGAFSPTGKNTHTKKHTEFGTFAQRSLFPRLKFCNQKHWDLYTEPCLETAASLTPTNTADSLDWLGHTEKSSRNGWNTKPIAFRLCNQSYELHRIRDTEIYQSVATHPVIPNSKMFLTSLNRMGTKKSSLWTGSIELPQKDLLGGSWMTVHSASVQKEVHRFDFIRKDTLPKKIKSLPFGLQQSVIQQQQSFIQGLTKARRTTTHTWAQTQLETGCQTSNSIQFHQWITSLEVVESVKGGGVERVYDIEVENNHNFVANELLVHNCHMLSVAAFNALLKTLEEPPDRVAFVLATTDPQRVLPTIISRCQRFDFRRIPLEPMVSHLRAIAAQENINIAEDALQLLAQIAQGGLRDAESLLDQLSLLPGQITVKRVWDLVGMVPEQDLMALLVAITHNNPEAVLDQARHLMDRGHEPLTLLHNLAGLYRDLLIAKTAPTRPDLVTFTLPTWTKLCDFAQDLDISEILAGQQHLRSCEAQVKNTTQPRLWLEVTLLGLLPSPDNRQPVGLNFHARAAVSNQRPEINHKPSTSQLERNAGVTTSRSPGVKQPAHSDTLATSSSNGTAQDQRVQPAQVEAFASSPHSSTTIEAPEPSNQPPPAQPSVEHVRQDAPKSTVRAGGPEALDSPAPPADAVIKQPNLNQIWQKVVAQLHPPGTQALLDQHGRLLAFDGRIARVGIQSQPLFKMAQARLPNIEAAFQKAFNHPVKVNLEVAVPTESRSTLPNEQPTPEPAPFEPVSLPQVVEPAVQHDTQFTAPQSTQPLQPSAKVPQVQPPLEDMKTQRHKDAETFSPSPRPNVPASPTAPTYKEDDEVTRAAKSLAQFFNGEIVSQENELVRGSTTPSDHSYPLEQPLTSSTKDDFSQPGGEDEIPF